LISPYKLKAAFKKVPLAKAPALMMLTRDTEPMASNPALKVGWKEYTQDETVSDPVKDNP